MIFIKKNGQIIRADGKSFNDILVIVSESSQTISEISVPVLTAEDVALAYNSMVAGKVVAIATENSEILNVNEANSVDDVVSLFVYFKDSHIIKYVLEDEEVEITAKEIGSGSGTGAVDSVNGKTGVVVLDADDIIYQNQETIKTALDNLNTAIAGKENTSNKTTTLSSSSTDTQYPSAKAVYDSVEEVREIAQEKVNAFVVDELSDITGTQDSDGNFTSVSAITGIDDLSVLKVGYNIYIKDTSVPDYWVSSIDPVIKLNKLAEKVDLTEYYKKTETYSKGEVDGLLNNKANVGASYTKQETDNLLDEKADSTDLANYETTTHASQTYATKGEVVNKQNKATTTTDSTHTTFSGALSSNVEYAFTQPLTSLSIAALEVQTGDEQPYWRLTFKTGSTISVSFTPTLKWVGGTPTFEANTNYVVIITKAIATGEYIATLGEF